MEKVTSYIDTISDKLGFSDKLAASAQKIAKDYNKVNRSTRASDEVISCASVYLAFRKEAKDAVGYLRLKGKYGVHSLQNQVGEPVKVWDQNLICRVATKINATLGLKVPENFGVQGYGTLNSFMRKNNGTKAKDPVERENERLKAENRKLKKELNILRKQE